MKTIAFLLLFLSMSFSYAGGNPKTPKEINKGETFQKVEKMFPNYHFKFYKKNTDENLVLSSFGMLGYWNKTEGCVLIFTEDKLLEISIFKELYEYQKFITNPKENNNIKIKKKNLFL